MRCKNLNSRCDTLWKIKFKMRQHDEFQIGYLTRCKIFISKSDTSLSFHFKIWHMVEFLIHNGTHCEKFNSESGFLKKKQKMPKILFSCIKVAEKCSFSVQIFCHLPICLKLLNSQSALRWNFKTQIWCLVNLSNQNQILSLFFGF